MASIVAFPKRPALTPAAYPTMPCACCLGRPGAAFFRDVWTCAGCAALLDRRAMAVTLDDGVWIYQGLTPAAGQWLEQGSELFDAGFQPAAGRARRRSVRRSRGRTAPCASGGRSRVQGPAWPVLRRL